MLVLLLLSILAGVRFTQVLLGSNYLEVILALLEEYFLCDLLKFGLRRKS